MNTIPGCFFSVYRCPTFTPLRQLEVPESLCQVLEKGSLLDLEFHLHICFSSSLIENSDTSIFKLSDLREMYQTLMKDQGHLL